MRSTVLPTAGSLPSAPGLRSPDHADVVHLFLACAACVDPTLDDLNAVEVAPFRILHRRHQEGRNLARLCGRQVATHRHALAIARVDDITAEISVGEVPAAEEAHGHARPGGGVGFLALHRIPNGRAGVLRSPDRGETGCDLLPSLDRRARRLHEGVIPALR